MIRQRPVQAAAERSERRMLPFCKKIVTELYLNFMAGIVYNVIQDRENISTSP